MIELPDAAQARNLFARLPPRQQLFTLSPDYVVADARRDPKLDPFFFAWKEGQDFWLHGAHRSPIPHMGWHDVQSPYGYGGPLATCTEPAFLRRAWTAYGDWCREEGILAEFVRFHPIAQNWKLYGGQVRDDRQTVAVPLGGDLMGTYSTRARTAVRKAGKSGIEGVWLPAEEHAIPFAEFYRQGMSAIGAEASYLFADDYFQALSRLPGAQLLVCRRGAEWLCAGLFLSGTETMEYHLSATSPEGRRLAATNLLIHHAAGTAQAAGCDWLYLGGGTDGREDNPLLFFKSGFSNHRLPYRIGRQVFAQETYDKLKDEWATAGRDTGRVLFYRF